MALASVSDAVKFSRDATRAACASGCVSMLISAITEPARNLAETSDAGTDKAEASEPMKPAPSKASRVESRV